MKKYWSSPFFASLWTELQVRSGEKAIGLLDYWSDGQNTDPQSLDHPSGLPKWSTLKWTTPKNTIAKSVLFKKAAVICTDTYVYFCRLALLHTAQEYARPTNGHT